MPSKISRDRSRSVTPLSHPQLQLHCRPTSQPGLPSSFPWLLSRFRCLPFVSVLPSFAASGVVCFHTPSSSSEELQADSFILLITPRSHLVQPTRPSFTFLLLSSRPYRNLLPKLYVVQQLTLLTLTTLTLTQLIRLCQHSHHAPLTLHRIHTQLSALPCMPQPLIDTPSPNLPVFFIFG